MNVGFIGLGTMGGRCAMSDLKKYIEKRTKSDTAFAEGFEAGYNDFKIGVLLRQAREAVRLTQAEVALQIGTKKSAISRIENHAENITALN